MITICLILVDAKRVVVANGARRTQEAFRHHRPLINGIIYRVPQGMPLARHAGALRALVNDVATARTADGEGCVDAILPGYSR